MTAAAHTESRDAPVSGVSLPAVILEKEGALSVFRCPIPCFPDVCLSADELCLVIVVLLFARCFISELIHVSVDNQADGQVAFQSVVVSTVETILADTTEAETFIIPIVVRRTLWKFPPCS